MIAGDVAQGVQLRHRPSRSCGSFGSSTGLLHQHRHGAGIEIGVRHEVVAVDAFAAGKGSEEHARTSTACGCRW